MKNKLILMCGLARCGKSTWISKNKGDAVIVSPDDIRRDIFGHQFHQNAEGYIWAIAETMVRLILKQEKDVIVDATNLTCHARDRFIKIARQMKIKTKIVWIMTKLDKCKENNKKSEKDKQIPEHIIEGMALCFLDPYYDEKDIEVIQVPKSNYKIQPYSNFYGNT